MTPPGVQTAIRFPATGSPPSYGGKGSPISLYMGISSDEESMPQAIEKCFSSMDDRFVLINDQIRSSPRNRKGVECPPKHSVVHLDSKSDGCNIVNNVSADSRFGW